MNDLEILIPTVAAMEPHLRHCLAGLAANTGIRSFQVIGLALDAQILSPFRASELQWTVWDYEGHTSAEAVLDAIERTQGVYVALLPPTHAIADKAWFSKLQLPFLRTPNCGMVVADELLPASSAAQPYQVIPRGEMPGQLVMAPRQTLSAIRRAAAHPAPAYADALLRAATSLGLATWAVPGIRIDVAHPVAEAARQESPDAGSAG